MERQFHDAVDDLVGALEQMTAEARALNLEANDPRIAARASSLHAQCERALVDSKKIAHLSSGLLHREPISRLVPRSR